MKSTNKAQKSNCIRIATNGGSPFLHYLKKLVFTVLALISVCTAALAQSPSLHEQLCGINSEWKSKQIDASLLIDTSIFPRDVDLIQKHLELVEGILREKNMDHLSETARKNRLSNLNLLKEYWESALFPVNLYHSERTPYFIDDFGTACAVGYLVIGSGNQDFAEKIRQDNNYAYISELNSEYPLLENWATANGFTIDELAWIQPSYSPPCTSNPCSPGTAIMPSCAFTCDGCYAPATPSWGCPPYTFSSATLFCNLCPGTYSYDVTDCIGTTQTYTVDMIAPPLLTVNISKNDNTCNGVCDGNALAIPAGGIPPYFYSWSTGDTSKTIDLLCTGTYFVTVFDINGCIAVDSTSVLETLNASVTTDGNTLTALPDGSAYKWLDCDNAHTPITGNTNQEYTPTASGTYAAAVTLGTCIDTTACRSVTLVNIPENTVSDLLIHPNPTTGIISIKGAQGIATVYNIYGKVVSASHTNTLDISETTTGIYFIRVVDKQGKVSVAKVLKE